MSHSIWNSLYASVFGII